MEAYPKELNQIYEEQPKTTEQTRAIEKTEEQKTKNKPEKTTEEKYKNNKKPEKIKIITTTAIIILISLIISIVQKKPTATIITTIAAIIIVAIPIGLQISKTITLTITNKKLAKKNIITQKNKNIETAGECTIICANKTGTLTYNEMTVKKIYANRETITISGDGYTTKGHFSKNPQEIQILLKIGILNNKAELTKEQNTWEAKGDKTETALLFSAKKAGINTEETKNNNPKIKEITQPNQTKITTTIHTTNTEKEQGQKTAYTKGDTKTILNICNRILINDRIERLTKAEKEKILEEKEKLEKTGLKTIAFSYKELKGIFAKGEIEQEMIFAGIQAMKDPIRKETKETIDKLKTQGIKTIIITEDYTTTANAVAKELEITGQTITGTELEKIENLEEQIEKISVFARITPSQKSKIINTLQKKGHTITIIENTQNKTDTKADLKIEITNNTETKKTNNITTKNFSSITNIIEETRKTINNIKKITQFQITTSIGIILTILISLALNWPIPITILQIIWIILITNIPPSIALGTETQDQTHKTTKIHDKKRTIITIITATIMMLGTLYIFDKYETKGLIYAQTAAFTTLMLYQIFNSLNQRSEEPLLKTGMLTNKKLILAIIISIGLQATAIYTPLMQKILGTTSIGTTDLIVIIVISATIIIFGELIKIFKKT